MRSKLSTEEKKYLEKRLPYNPVKDRDYDAIEGVWMKRSLLVMNYNSAERK